MAAINLKALVGKLNETSRRALEEAVGYTVSRGHYDVEIEHFLAKALEADNTDLQAIFAHFDVDISRFAKDLARNLDGLRTGNNRAPSLSPHLVNLSREAWLEASLQFSATQARTGHILCALLNEEALARVARDISSELGRIPGETLREHLETITGNSTEAVGSAPSADDAPSSAPQGASAASQPGLSQYTVDLTAQAREGRIDPVLGRDGEVRQIIDILTRRRQNNPILTGEAGVGKTAVVEGFALRIAAGDVPESLQNVTLRSLDLALLQAGASVRGEFENRLRSVIDEVKASPTPIVLFIDEAHSLIGAGGQAGQGDAANLLKPALARGELRTIAATTWAEYKKYFERDAALARRFQVVKVEEPSESLAQEMMRGLVGKLEEHHGVRILDEAVREAVRLSSRYISGRQLPDKAVSLIDTACANVAMALNTEPPSIEDLRRRIGSGETRTEILNREAAAGADHDETLSELATELESLREEYTALTERRAQEIELASELRGLREELENLAGDAPDRPEKLARLRQSAATLEEVQGDSPLILPHVDGQAVANVVSSWTGIPVGRMVSNEINSVLELQARMEENVIGQSHALEAIAQSVQTSRAQLGDPGQPVGVFMLAGTSGVGKTETAITLANMLYGGEQNMTVINMSEFKEEHKVSLLMGSPPGYVGYGEGGVLTEAVRRKPYSVVLLDEMEKAHPGVQDIFYQVFDKGTMKDGEGRDIDFRNTLILMTTNAGTETLTSLFADPETAPEADALREALWPELLQHFKPAFLGRTTVIPYVPLNDEVLALIVALKLKKIAQRVEENYRAEFTYSDALVENIVSRCQEVDTGARNVDFILRRGLLPSLAAEFLGRLADGEAVSAVHVDVGDDDTFSYAIK